MKTSLQLEQRSSRMLDARSRGAALLVVVFVMLVVLVGGIVLAKGKAKAKG